jgi:hypothetical protein
MRLRAVLPGLTAALCLCACGTAADLAGANSGRDRTERSSLDESPVTPTETPPTEQQTTPTTEPDDKRLKRLPHVVSQVDFFLSPSRNIGCLITGSSVRCDIDEKSYREPAQPSSCQLDWGKSVEVGRAGEAEYACVDDSVLGAGSVLDYNTSTVVGDFGCTSRETGMTCYNLRTRHGFLISREIVDLF